MAETAVESRPIGLAEIREIEERSYRVIGHLSEQFNAGHRGLGLHFTVTQAADMVGRTPTAIRDAEKAGKLPSPQVNDKGRRMGYALTEVNHMRGYFGTLPHRGPGDEPLIMAVQNFKGGCGKSTVTVHLAQFLALQGYRVCVVDMDPQASTTALFGFNPDRDINQDETLYAYLLGEQSTLDYALRATYWDQLQIVPANLSLYEAEYVIAGQAAQARGDAGAAQFMRLRDAIDTISHRFDVVLIDAPPALGMISLSVLNAANALVVPVRPATIDFASTAHFFTMLLQTYSVFVEYGIPEPRFKFLRVLANDVDETKSAHVAIAAMMQEVYGTSMLRTLMKDSAEIDNAGARLQSVYELDGPITSRGTHQRGKAYLNAVNREIEILIRKTWPSHHAALRMEGIM